MDEKNEYNTKSSKNNQNSKRYVQIKKKHF